MTMRQCINAGTSVSFGEINWPILKAILKIKKKRALSV
jgi:hypothetical protein